MSTAARPLIKWVGGKTQILPIVLAEFPAAIRNYHEPFVGGGATLLGALSLGRITGTVYASDINPHLIAMYRNVQQYPGPVIRALGSLQRDYEAATATAASQTGLVADRSPTTRAAALRHPESYYYWIRTAFNGLPPARRTSPTAAAMLIFLNKTCFRGVYREGPHGFNVPFGNYRAPTILDEANIRAVSALIQGVVFTCQSFEAALATAAAAAAVPTAATATDFVYLDPPYVPLTATSFVGYVADGFTAAQHADLFARVRALSTPFLLSNADVPLLRTEFPEPSYSVRTVDVRRAIHSKNPDSRATEVLIQRQAT